MTPAQPDRALHPFLHRRPFRKFLVEFTSGAQSPIRHPEALRKEGSLYVIRTPDGGNIVFPSESVSRLLDGPDPTSA